MTRSSWRKWTGRRKLSGFRRIWWKTWTKFQVPSVDMFRVQQRTMMSFTYKWKFISSFASGLVVKLIGIALNFFFAVLILPTPRWLSCYRIQVVNCEWISHVTNWMESTPTDVLSLLFYPFGTWQKNNFWFSKKIQHSWRLIAVENRENLLKKTNWKDSRKIFVFSVAESVCLAEFENSFHFSKFSPTFAWFHRSQCLSYIWIWTEFAHNIVSFQRHNNGIWANKYSYHWKFLKLLLPAGKLEAEESI